MPNGQGFTANGVIQTHSGGHIDVTHPRADQIHIDDIAIPLSRQPRFAGHSIRFVSVAEHCVHVAGKAPSHLKLTALMHDASEAYLVDIPRPIKPLLQNYYEIEDGLMSAIADKFGFVWPMPDEIKLLDTRHLASERDQNILSPDPAVWGSMPPPLDITLQYWSPERAQQEFTAAFLEYGGRV